MRRRSLLPEPCPECHDKFGFIEEVRIQKYGAKNNSTPNAYEYRYVRIVHSGKNGIRTKCRLKPDAAQRFIGLKYKSLMQKLESAFRLYVEDSRVWIERLQQHKIDIAKSQDIDQELASSIQQTDDQLIEEYQQVIDLYNQFAEHAREHTLTDLDEQQIDDMTTMLSLGREMYSLSIDLAVSGYDDVKQKKVDDIATQYLNLARKVGMFDDKEKPLTIKEMLSDLKKQDEELTLRIDKLIIDTVKGKENDYDRVLTTLRMDLSRLYDNEDEIQALETIFNTNPTTIPYLRIFFLSHSLLEGMNIIIKKYPERFGTPPSNSEDVSRLPSPWNFWYYLLSKMVERWKVITDKRIKLDDSKFNEIQEDLQNLSIRKTAKKYGVSSKQLKKFVRKKADSTPQP